MQQSHNNHTCHSFSLISNQMKIKMYIIDIDANRHISGGDEVDG